MKRHVHYEAAFQQYLQDRQVPYVAVDEARRAAFRDARLKSFDFIVYAASQSNWLVDVKGRRWTGRNGRGRWENWITQADLDGLRQWETVFGGGFRALLVFAYQIPPDQSPPPEVLHAFRDGRYVFAGVPLEEYRLHARTRSPKWGTINLSTADFARCVRPVGQWLA